MCQLKKKQSGYTEEELSVGESKKARIFSLTFIQVVCAIAVVTLHTNGCFWQFSATESYWFSANIIECVAYFAVPVFFMITGITLLDYREKYSTRVYFRKRFEKTVIPYIAWSLIGVIFSLLTKRLSYETLSAKYVVNGLLSTDGIVSFYWFFQPLFCIYMCIPVFASIEKEKKKRAAEYIILINLAVNLLPPFLNSTLGLGFQWPYSVSVASGYCFWVWAGYYLYHYPPKGLVKEGIYLLAIIGLMLHIIGTYTLSIEAGEINRLYKGYNNIPGVLYSIGVFQLLSDVAKKIENRKPLRQLVEILGKYTFPLYLIHWFVLKTIQDLGVINERSLYYRLFAPYAIFIVVIGITWLLRKIPVIKKIVP